MIGARPMGFPFCYWSELETELPGTSYRDPERIAYWKHTWLEFEKTHADEVKRLERRRLKWQTRLGDTLFIKSQIPEIPYENPHDALVKDALNRQKLDFHAQCQDS